MTVLTSLFIAFKHQSHLKNPNLYPGRFILVWVWLRFPVTADRFWGVALLQMMSWREKISTWWLVSTPITKYTRRGQTLGERCPGNTLWWPSFLPAIAWFGFPLTKHSESCFCRGKLHYRCHLLLIRSDMEASCEVRLGGGCSSQSGLGVFRSIFVPEKLTCSPESVLWVRWQKMMLIRKNRRERVSSYATPANSAALSHVTISHIWVVVVVSVLIAWRIYPFCWLIV